MRLVQVSYGFNRLDFNNDFIGDDHIGSVSTLDSLRFVDDRQDDLPSEWDVLKTEFMAEARLIGRFEQSGTKLAMNLNRGADDLTCQPFFIQHGTASLL